MTRTTTSLAKPRSKRSDAKTKSSSTARSSNGANSLLRMLGVFDLFTPAAPTWSSEALIRALGMSRSTGYRYIKALADVGLLSPVLNGHYVLGPRIIELDLQIRRYDPLYVAAGPAMRKLVKDSGFSTLVCELFRGSVLCVREELTPDSPPHLFSRGQRRTLFRGAASKIILAYLGPHQLRSIYANHPGTIATSGLGADWASFRTNLAEIRRAGFASTLGEFNPGVVGVAAPIFNSAEQILGSISVAGPESKFGRTEIANVSALVKKAADQISKRIAVIGAGSDRPARAVGQS